jgi:glutamate-1-semialdehyde 2,1-aminomutase
VLAATVDRARVSALLERELRRFAQEHPRSRELFERARVSMLNGVPMPFMTEWPGGFPIYAASAHGAEVVDVDGLRYADLCLGDTGAMTGHGPAAALDALVEQFELGATHMLPTEDWIWVAEELGRRFGLPAWQFALSATDANRFVLRLAREITGRPRILVFNWCYHGTVDETIVTVVAGVAGPRPGNVGPAVDPALTTRVVEFNDLDALDRALAEGDVACVLAEPAMTNIGIILPERGFHDGLRELTRRHGTLLVIDETHTLCAGPGGCTREWQLEPDAVVLGKPIGSGIPVAGYGFSEDLARRILVRFDPEQSVTGGLGGTLAGGALGARVARATLEHVLTEEAHARMTELGARYEEAVAEAIADAGAPWCITRLGCRAEYRFQPVPPRNGTESVEREDRELMRLMHLYALNRGVLLTPFHNMALVSPATTEAHVDAHTAVFREALGELTA